MPKIAGTLAYRRFESPDRPINAARFRSPAFGAESGDEVPGSAVADAPEVLPGQTHADAEFYGIRSRSRFGSPLRFPEFGHGTAQTVEPAPSRRDPAIGRSQFDDRFVEPHVRGFSASSMTEFPVRTEYASSLGQQDVALAREGVLRFARPDYGVAPAVGTQPIIGPPSWYAAGPAPPSMRLARAGTRRREFMQWAQSFPGLRDVLARRSFASTSPVRMAGPLTNRLTRRSLPASFGSRTEVLNG